MSEREFRRGRAGRQAQRSIPPSAAAMVLDALSIGRETILHEAVERCFKDRACGTADPVDTSDQSASSTSRAGTLGSDECARVLHRYKQVFFFFFPFLSFPCIIIFIIILVGLLSDSFMNFATNFGGLSPHAIASLVAIFGREVPRASGRDC